MPAGSLVQTKALVTISLPSDSAFGRGGGGIFGAFRRGSGAAVYWLPALLLADLRVLLLGGGAAAAAAAAPTAAAAEAGGGVVA